MIVDASQAGGGRADGGSVKPGKNRDGRVGLQAAYVQRRWLLA